MKNTLYKISMVAALALSLVSCKKYLDINENPNNAENVDPKLLFSNATAHLVNNRAGGDLYIPMILAGQSMSGGGSSTEGLSWGTQSEDQYVFSPFSTGNIWTQYYTSIGFNLKKAIELCENPGGGLAPNNNGAAQSKVLLAEMFYELAVIYGDVPFTEALLGDTILEPKFDEQQVVLNGAIGLLDEALSQFDEDSDFRIEGAYDMIYGGDIELWIKAAKSLKLRMLMTMVDADPSKAALIGEMITAGGFISSPAENMFVPFQDVAGKKNPKFAISEQYLDGMSFFYASPYVLDYLKANDDPRIPIFFTQGPKANDYRTVDPGDNAIDSLDAKINSDLNPADQPEYLFTYQEQLFFEAEVYARGLGVAPDLAKANTLYKEAVKQSQVFFGVDPIEATNFVTGLAPITGVSNPMYFISYEHWIDKMDRGVDAFTQWRRSGPEGSEVPALTIPVNAPEDGLFRRYEYPSSAETASNPNAPELIRYSVKTWFDL